MRRTFNDRRCWFSAIITQELSVLSKLSLLSFNMNTNTRSCLEALQERNNPASKRWRWFWNFIILEEEFVWGNVQVALCISDTFYAQDIGKEKNDLRCWQGRQQNRGSFVIKKSQINDIKVGSFICYLEKPIFLYVVISKSETLLRFFRLDLRTKQTYTGDCVLNAFCKKDFFLLVS